MSFRLPRPLPSFGQIALASLLIALISGLPLALAYDPTRAEASLQLLRLGNLSGRVLRGLHAWAGHVFLVATLLHTVEHLIQRSQARLKPGPWLRVTLLIPLALAVMLTGFLLRGDADARMALRILSGLLARLELPQLRHSLLGQGGDLSTIYLHHVFTATLPLWAISVEHGRRLWPRASALLISVFLACALLLLLPIGLHGGVEPLKTGPWYFLGLQEALHWLPRPEWSLVLALILTVAFAALRWRPQSRALSGGLLLALGLYIGLSLLAALGRGPGWRLRWADPPMPSRAERPWRLFDLSAALSEPPPERLDRPEGCLICHQEVTGFAPAHEGIGCAACHLGDPLTMDPGRAHDGLVRVPGNLDSGALTCGACHAELLARVEGSLMATGRGMVAVDRFVFGEQAQPEGHATLAELGDSPADQHLRQLCVRCHLNNPKLEPAPLSELSRGGGCVACHLQDPDPRRPFKADEPFAHPALTAAVTDDHCFGCHSRSGRISLSYQGLGETLLKPKEADEEARVLEDGRVLAALPADVHHQRGMSCVDCHTARDTMGDGQRHLHQEEAVEIDCRDCHRVEAPEVVAPEDLDVESNALLRLRGGDHGPEPYVRTLRSGHALNNVRWVEGRVRVDRKRGGPAWWPKPPAATCQTSRHARLSCRSCHTGWSHRCVSCHTGFDPKGSARDGITGEALPGRFRERRDAPRFEAPTLGLRGEAGRIEPFAPGMIMRLDLGHRALDWRLYAPVAPHTTTTEGRGCKSCHLNAQALGIGRGALEFKGGAWQLKPALAPLADGLPADAWIGLFTPREGFTSTRVDARPLDPETQRRILTVGRCLGCHDEDAPLFEGFAEALKARTPACRVGED